jgi:hypothetical protein
MTGFALRWLGLLLAIGIGMQAASALALQVDSERYRAAPSARSVDQPRPRLADPDPERLIIRLPPLGPDAWPALADDSLRRQLIGVGRVLPQPLDSAELRWIELDDGGLAANVQINSPEAAALRLQLRAQSWPDGAELRVHAPGHAGVALLTGADLKPDRPHWLPTVDGDTLLLELYLPPGSDPDSIGLTLPRLSHLRATTQAMVVSRNLDDIGRSGYCQVDVACQDAGLPAVIIDSVAKYLFSDGTGRTFLCSGQLLNDTDPDSQIPYFLTANHCIDQASDAVSMEFYWFFQRARCDSPDPINVTRTGGGAILLATSRQTDFSLLRLNREPPDDVGLSGWSADPIEPGDNVFGLHHPRGDLRKISFGTARRMVTVRDQGGGDNFIETQWYLGVTEPGSSGSGLWRDRDGEPRLVGNLLGGYSSCQAPRQPDYYGRFDRTLAQVSAFLAPPPREADATARLLNISTNGEVDAGRGLVAGFIVTGDAPKRFVIMGENRGELADPRLQVSRFPGGEPLEANDDWRDHPTAGEVEGRLRRPGGERDAALALTLGPGQYLATLSDGAGRGGRGLVSVTEITP